MQDTNVYNCMICITNDTIHTDIDTETDIEIDTVMDTVTEIETDTDLAKAFFRKQK